ncbi:hypothetical protein BJY01DRAFT_252030 [Aspergillus pseudoustus]|uniref:Beta-glucuronidase C-terminal domain-containing protein n=1 Tax=Aspergillus pseudoustus TaxID=1810923 RepID=A0ABR4J8L9_9EURO
MISQARHIGFLASLAMQSAASSLQYAIPSKPPQNATPLEPTPIGMLFEFYMWPSYMTNITPPMHCVERLSDIYGHKTPIRIGGTTQDRATYDPDFDGYISYINDDPLVAPMELTYGPKFWDLIAKYDTESMLGFNRGDNNRTNMLSAVLEARRRAGSQLWAVEIGNEPDVYNMWNKSIVVPPWNASQEGESAADWAQSFIDVWEEPLPIIAAGSYAVTFPDNPNWPNVPYLINTAFNHSGKAGVKTYSGHLYAAPPNETDLAGEMNHAKTVSDLAVFTESIALSHSEGRPFILGETSFHPYDVHMDETFGAALAALDKSMRAVTMGIQPLFNWWSDDQINAPFYGGYMAVLALADGTRIVELDEGNSSYAVYVIYSGQIASKILLVNTDYYASGVRAEARFTLTGLRASRVSALRLTAQSSEVVTTRNQTQPSAHPTLGGQWFSNADCSSLGSRKIETARVARGTATFSLKASEALLIYV